MVDKVNDSCYSGFIQLNRKKAMATNLLTDMTLLSPIELAEKLTEFQSRNECIDFMNKFSNRLRISKKGDKPLQPSTVSKNMTAYRTEVLNYSSNGKYAQELLDDIQGNLQHFVIQNFLTLTSEELKTYNEKQDNRKLKKAGVNSDGNVVIKDLADISISGIIEKISDWYLSNKAEKLAVYIMFSTGLRGCNVCVTSSKDSDGNLIKRTMDYYDDNLISMNAIAKKRGEDKKKHHIIQTILPAENVLSAYESLMKLHIVRKLKSDKEFTNSGIRSNIRRLIDDEIPELKDSDDEYGCIHNLRGLYAGILFKLYRLDKLNQNAATMLTQKNLVHDSESQTQKYLNKFGYDRLINLPSDIKLEKNFDVVGEFEPTTDENLENDLDPVEVVLDPVESVVDPVENIVESNSEHGLNFAKIISKLSPIEQSIIAEELYNNCGEIEDVLIASLQAFCKSKPKNHKASDTIVEIFNAVNEYNSQCSNPNQKVVVGLAVTEKIYSQITNGKSLTRKYFRIKYDENKEEIMKYLGDISYDELNAHNGKYHKKDFPQIISKIVEIYHQM